MELAPGLKHAVFWLQQEVARLKVKFLTYFFPRSLRWRGISCNIFVDTERTASSRNDNVSIICQRQSSWLKIAKRMASLALMRQQSIRKWQLCGTLFDIQKENVSKCSRTNSFFLWNMFIWSHMGYYKYSMTSKYYNKLSSILLKFILNLLKTTDDRYHIWCVCDHWETSVFWLVVVPILQIFFPRRTNSESTLFIKNYFSFLKDLPQVGGLLNLASPKIDRRCLPYLTPSSVTRW